MAHINPISLDELKDNATNCRVKRHLISTITHEHGQTAETKPDSTIRTQRVKIAARDKCISPAGLRNCQEQFQLA
jgi:hypothetical protein